MAVLKPFLVLAVMVIIVAGIYHFFIYPWVFGTTRVIHVVDADTLLVLEGKKVKEVQLIGADAPEYLSPRQYQCFGEEARNTAGKYFTGNTEVKLDKDEKVADPPQPGPQVRYISLKNGDFYNEKLIQNGLAQALTNTSQPYRYQERFQKAQTEAQQKGVGIWNSAGCKGNF